MAAKTSSGYCFPDISGEPECGAARSDAPCFRRIAPGAEPGRSAVRGGRRSEQARVDLEQEFYCKGFADGERTGLEQGERTGAEAVLRRLDTLLESLRLAAGEMERLRADAARTHEWELVQLALAVAAKIVEREVRQDPAAIAVIVQSALARVEHAERITVRLNPTDAERLNEVRARVLETLAAGDAAVSFHADEHIRAGGCLIESDRGDVDARLEQRFRVVEEAFHARWSADSAAGAQSGAT
jgi:flagellar biosynthesis/type III secretory pathway protein FliH